VLQLNDSWLNVSAALRPSSGQPVQINCPQIKISNRFAVLENLRDKEHINRYWKNINENIKISVKGSLGLYELKQHKP